MSDHAKIHLFVDSKGNIVGDRVVRMDVPGHETWLFEHVRLQIHLRQLYPLLAII